MATITLTPLKNPIGSSPRRVSRTYLGLLAAGVLCLTIGTCPVHAQVLRAVYRNTFERGAGGGLAYPGVQATWSHPATELTPNGRYGRFLGQFGNDTVRLTLTGLPRHNGGLITIRLFIIRSWDGNSQPDLWEFGLTGSGPLLRTTFDNHDPAPGRDRQSYPGSYPSDYPARTGALENNSLGYWDGVQGMEWGDAVYRFSRTFAHQGSTMEITFQGSGLQQLFDESWGLDDVSVALNLTR
jgi:hypothetical protein